MELHVSTELHLKHVLSLNCPNFVHVFIPISQHSQVDVLQLAKAVVIRWQRTKLRAQNDLTFRLTLSRGQLLTSGEPPPTHAFIKPRSNDEWHSQIFH